MSWQVGVSIFMVMAVVILITSRCMLREARNAAARVKGIQAGRHDLSAAWAKWGGEVSVPADVRDRVLRAVAKISTFALTPAVLKVDAGRIWPEDQLIGDLALELDSLGFLELIVTLEKEFGVKFARQESDAVRSAGDVVTMVARKLIENDKSMKDVQH